MTLRLFRQGELLYFEAIDDGQGFSANDLEQALTPFYTSASPDSQHYGLGLTICKTLCENHGRGISIINTKDSGAKVEVLFSLKNRDFLDIYLINSPYQKIRRVFLSPKKE